MNVSELPFNKYFGIEDRDGRVTVRVTQHHKNHLGTVHATVIFGVAEACSGKFMIEHFAAEFPDALAVTRSGAVKYRAPAKEDLFAEVVSTEPGPEAAVERLRLKGAAKVSIEVKVHCNQELVATATFDWFIKRG